MVKDFFRPILVEHLSVATLCNVECDAKQPMTSMAAEWRMALLWISKYQKHQQVSMIYQKVTKNG